VLEQEHIAIVEAVARFAEAKEGARSARVGA